MDVIINDNKYNKINTIKYNSYAYSDIYNYEDTIIIIDYNICDNTEMFEYSKITESQNKYMDEYNKVYRFLYVDVLSNQYVEDIINGNDEFTYSNKYTRDYVLDNSVLEYKFEEKIQDIFGSNALEKLIKEYPINDSIGNTYNLDYYFEDKNQRIAIEENGVNYHHPQIIGIQRYIKQLNKQNACTYNGIKLYRFSSEDLRFEDKINETLSTYFSNIIEGAYNKQIKVNRSFELYDHQENVLDDLKEKREKGLKTALVVLPTGSGKSMIVEEDIRSFNNPNLKILVLAPSIVTKNDWIKRFKKELPNQKNVQIETYAKINMTYNNYDQNYFDYIVIDEAHHAVAIVLKRTIQYFNPIFLIGLTATDERLDNKKLEEVFGEYDSKLSLEEAMNKGIVAKANVYRIETNLNLSQVRFNGKDYFNNDLEKSIRVTSRNELIADVIERYFSNEEFINKQGVIFCVNINHAKEVAKILNEHNLNAKPYVSTINDLDKTMEEFKEKKVRFLCACDKLSEGWDYPELGILIMARPTMSKVLYLQQIGRGLRKTRNKENVFIIDVVDEYGAMLKPWSMHSLFHNMYYVPFGDVLKHNYEKGDMIVVDGLHERVTNIKKIDINTFEETYKDYINQKQLALECFVNDNTINNWIKKKEIIPNETINFGSKNIYLFSQENVDNIFINKKITKHNDETIKEDFFNFVNQNDFTFSYKMIFMLAMLKNVDINGEVSIDEILDDYIYFYKERLDNKIQIDRENCKLNYDKLNDRSFMKRNLLTNPFEKYERKRFLYYSKDLNKLSFSPSLFNKLTKEDKIEIESIIRKQLKEYYKDMDGVQPIQYLERDYNE